MQYTGGRTCSGRLERTLHGQHTISSSERQQHWGPSTSTSIAENQDCGSLGLNHTSAHGQLVCLLPWPTANLADVGCVEHLLLVSMGHLYARARVCKGFPHQKQKQLQAAIAHLIHAALQRRGEMGPVWGWAPAKLATT
jgi:hypothetical protein